MLLSNMLPSKTELLNWIIIIQQQCRKSWTLLIPLKLSFIYFWMRNIQRTHRHTYSHIYCVFQHYYDANENIKTSHFSILPNVKHKYSQCEERPQIQSIFSLFKDFKQNACSHFWCFWWWFVKQAAFKRLKLIINIIISSWVSSLA